MGQVLHGSARTTAAVPRAIQQRQESLRSLAKRNEGEAANEGCPQYGLSNGALDLSDPRSRCEPDPYRLASLAAVRREAPSRDAPYRACRPGSLARVYRARRTALRASAVKNSKGGSEREAPGEGPDPRLTYDERTRLRHCGLSGVARA